MKSEREKIYKVCELRSLSTIVLYTGKLPPMGPGGFGVLPSSGGKISKKLDISGYPSSKPIVSNKIGTVSDFKPVTVFKNEPAIERTSTAGIIERYRVGDHGIGVHINYEEFIPKKIRKTGNPVLNKLFNIHIDLDKD